MDLGFSKATIFSKFVRNDRFFDDYKDDLRFSEDSLNGKRIIFVGGGRSKIKLSMDNRGIKPKSVLNIDPYLCDGTIDDDDKIFKFVKEDFTKTNYINACDKLLAEWSLPAYCETLEQLFAFWQKGVTATAAGGDMHVYPCHIRMRVTPNGVEGENEINDEFWGANKEILAKLCKAFPRVSVNGNFTKIVSLPADEIAKAEINDYCAREMRL